LTQNSTFLILKTFKGRPGGGEEWKNGRMEGWETGIMEYWNIGMMEEWKTEKL
jgi:hypothetical protein